MSVANEPPSGDDGDATIPKAFGAGEFVQDGFLSVEQIAANNVWSAIVYTVPAPNVFSIAHVKSKNALLLVGISTVELSNENGVGQRTFIVDAGFD